MWQKEEVEKQEVKEYPTLPASSTADGSAVGVVAWCTSVALLAMIMQNMGHNVVVAAVCVCVVVQFW